MRGRQGFTLIELLGGAPTATPPSTPAEQLALGGSLKTDVTHTGWTEGQAFQTGMTFVQTPNSVVPFSSKGLNYDVDFVSSRDGSSATVAGYDAMNSRSYHTGGVNVLLIEGSVRFISNNIAPVTWRALGTRAGGEVVGNY